ncbi:MAG TPA: tetratricopeptide repeat protein [Leptolyngbyaceae cyanobacterium M33_DOE_097]|uniref:Tetratricopeptide repeat protein n=1 Tax=Oscillatoriales cyanobacterium SpSt-418 TaxID=2282169 RepID=A0A7C3PPV3_9CYAN|nr:tetratricopeptide repeat protein [Leptolyngbyaceae cyanobacterium M33_DOE_097]
MSTRMHWGLMIVGVLLTAPAIAAPTAAEYRQMGLQLRNQERYTDAIAALQKAVELEPNNVSGRVLLGWTQHKADQRVEAAATLTQAFYLNPFDVPTLNALGIVQLVEGQLGGAIASHGWAAVLKADNEIAYYNLSLAFERIGQYDWAIAAAQKAATLEPNNPHPLVAEAVAHWGNGEKEQAQRAYQRAQSLNGAYADPGYLAIDLPRAGFSETQLGTSQQIRKSL